jgi:sugar lactone lactonase YvrE
MNRFVPVRLAVAGLVALSAVVAGCGAGGSALTPAFGAAGAGVATHARSSALLRPAASTDEALFISDTAGGAGNGFVVRTTKPYSNYQTIDKNLDQNGAIAIDSKDDLIVADVGASKVLVYPSPYTGKPEKISTDIAFPSALALNSKQTLFVANAATNSVAYVDSPYTGTVKRLLTGIAAPFALAFDGSDDLFIANAPHSGSGGNVVEYAAPYSGSPKTLTAGIGLPRALAVDSKGNLFVASYTGPGQSADVAIFAPPYTGKPTIVTDKITAPISIALSPDGTLFVANAPQNGGYGKDNVGNIAVFAAPYTGSPRLITARVNTPQALLVDGSGTLFAAMRGGDDGYGFVGELKSPYTGTFTEIKNPADSPSALAVAPPVPLPSQAPQIIGLASAIALPNASSGGASASVVAAGRDMPLRHRMPPAR